MPIQLPVILPTIAAVAVIGAGVLMLDARHGSKALPVAPVARVSAPVGEAAYVASSNSVGMDETRSSLESLDRTVNDMLAGKVAEAYPQGVKLKVPGDTTVVRMGSEGATPSSTGNGGTCLFHPGRTVTVMGHDAEFGVLVRYDVLGGPEVNECEDKMLTFFNSSVLGRWVRFAPTQEEMAARRKRALDGVVRIVGH